MTYQPSYWRAQPGSWQPPRRPSCPDCTRLRAERDRARDLAAHLEQELADAREERRGLVDDSADAKHWGELVRTRRKLQHAQGVIESLLAERDSLAPEQERNEIAGSLA